MPGPIPMEEQSESERLITGAHQEVFEDASRVISEIYESRRREEGLFDLRETSVYIPRLLWNWVLQPVQEQFNEIYENMKSANDRNAIRDVVEIAVRAASDELRQLPEEQTAEMTAGEAKDRIFRTAIEMIQSREVGGTEEQGIRNAAIDALSLGRSRWLMAEPWHTESGEIADNFISRTVPQRRPR
ncbi:hypothetical protein GF318_01490 [Candidatus Micrarchaeota archaeon]|nr:hypothetical protein [Candidatus Micrarchaeota archaeon]